MVRILRPRLQIHTYHIRRPLPSPGPHRVHIQRTLVYPLLPPLLILHRLKQHNGHLHDQLHGLRLGQARVCLIPPCPLKHHVLYIDTLLRRRGELRLWSLHNNIIEREGVDRY